MLDFNPPRVIVFETGWFLAQKLMSVDTSMALMNKLRKLSSDYRRILSGIPTIGRVVWSHLLDIAIGPVRWYEARIDMGWNLELPAVAKSTTIEPLQAKIVAELSATFLLPLSWVLSPSSNKQ